MNDRVALAFQRECVFVNVDDILPVKRLSDRITKTRKYKQIAASIKEVGIVEAPVVSRVPGKKGKFLLLDGHLRVAISKELGTEEIMCLVATEDEAFTYNKRVNRLATIQEHKMILRAIKRGVSEERLAKALDIDISGIRQKSRLLVGICPEVVELLKDRHCPLNTFQCLKKMTPMRQIEVVELMIAMNNFTTPYVRALLAATPQNELVESDKPKKFKGVSAEQIAQMEAEMAKLQSEMKLVEESYGRDHLNLVLSRGYIISLLDNKNIVRYLKGNHQEILTEFRKISQVVSMGTVESE